MERHLSPTPQRSAAGMELTLLVGVVFLIGVYVLLRFGGRGIGGNDATIFTQTSNSILVTGSLTPEGMPIYPNGYGAQSLNVFLSHMTGLSLSDLQTYAGVLLLPWIVLPAWLLYREWLSSGRGATLATLIFILQPEILFTSLRGTHEKFTRGLMLLSLYLLARSMRGSLRPVVFALYVVCFYVCIYAIITFNNLFAVSFIVAILFTMLASRFLLGKFPMSKTIVQRCTYTIATSLLLSFVFTFYAYLPATRNLELLRSIGDRIAALFLNIQESAPTNPYTVISSGWVSLPVYLAVSIADWLLLVSSALIWLAQTVRWKRRGEGPSSQNEIFLWAFYLAFGLLGAISIVADVGGAISSNLQHRAFPSIAMVAAPLLAQWILSWSARQRPGALLRRASIVGVVGAVALLSLLKATNEPLLSNKWTFYLPEEKLALLWADQKLTGRSVWTEFDDRLTGVLVGETREGESIEIDRFQLEPYTRDLMISDLTRLRSQRLAGPLPLQSDDLITYDNGPAQLYHRRPITPYQE